MYWLPSTGDDGKPKVHYHPREDAHGWRSTVYGCRLKPGMRLQVGDRYFLTNGADTLWKTVSEEMVRSYKVVPEPGEISIVVVRPE